MLSADTPDSTVIGNIPYDLLNIGQQAHLQRTITRNDINAFALVSGDMNPAHVDADYAQGTRFHEVIAHGMFAGALISSLLGTEFPGPGTIYIEQTLRFLRPVHVDDCLDVCLTVLEKDDKTHNVWLDCLVTNQRNETVVSGRALVRAPTSHVSRARMLMPAMHLFDPTARLQAWMQGLRQQLGVRCAVVHPCDEGSLSGALDAAERGLIVPVLVGPVARVRALAASLQRSLVDLELVDTPHSHESAAIAATMAANGEVGMLMKGSLHTDELMQAVLAQPRLRTGRRMSHVFRFDVPAYPKPILITDAAINVSPSLEEKADIVRNAIELANRLGVARPKVALLSALETVTPRVASTLDAAALCKMAQRGQITGADLDGPLAFDNAISAQAARIKGIESVVAGHADILVVPDLESGNMLAKQLEYLAGAASCGVVLGARVPIALTSRADSAISRMASAALAALAADGGGAQPRAAFSGQQVPEPLRSQSTISPASGPQDASPQWT